MKIQEAIKSGKKYRRKGCEFWLTPGDTPICISEKEILAEDWEIEREPREIWGFRFSDGMLASVFQGNREELLMYYPNGNGKPVKFREVIE